MDLETKQMEKVQRIIALKRFEQPPPGYFHLLPSRIINRIEKGEGKSTAWENWLGGFTIRPVWACAFGLSLCAAVTLGMFYPVQTDVAIASASPASAGSPWAGSALAADDSSAASTGLHLAALNASTDPVPANQPPLFNMDSREALAMPALFHGD
jgi:hypothetical protein